MARGLHLTGASTPHGAVTDPEPLACAPQPERQTPVDQQTPRLRPVRDPLRLKPLHAVFGLAAVILFAGTAFAAAGAMRAPKHTSTATPARVVAVAPAPKPSAAPAPVVTQAPAPEPAAAPTPAPRPRPVVKTQAPDPWAGYAQQDLAYWNKLKDGGYFGHITMPKAGADIDVVKGAGDANIVAHAGQVTGTDYPGPHGNVAIGAHRTIYKHPFRHIDDLKKGDQIILRSPFREYRYTVYDAFVVRATDNSVLRYSNSPIITIVACHPPGSSEFRYIVRGKLTSVTRLAKS
jgi:LPXTG-site transpeptidase (sortase) family protein